MHDTNPYMKWYQTITCLFIALPDALSPVGFLLVDSIHDVLEKFIFDRKIYFLYKQHISQFNLHYIFLLYQEDIITRMQAIAQRTLDNIAGYLHLLPQDLPASLVDIRTLEHQSLEVIHANRRESQATVFVPHDPKPQSMPQPQPQP